VSFDLADLVFVLNPGTIGSLLIAGAVLGALFLRDRRAPGSPMFLAALAGLVFFATMTAVRYGQAADQWEIWIGDGGLWIGYIAAMLGGGWCARRLRRRRRPE